ncbi:MAG: hypothetical protein LBH25_14255 [Fibromonadaceae bacterium]|jgi:hypothetical protein|nr:hypothetical protein [Fibromonadaceae bacterium]
MDKIILFVCLLIWAFNLARASDAWFSASLPIKGKLYPITARFHLEKNGDSLKFSSEAQYRTIDTSFSMHTTGVFNLAKNVPIWQNTVRSGLYSVEWSFKDYTEKPAAVYWRGESNKHSSTSFENDAIPEEFLYFLSSRVDSIHTSWDFKMLSPAWEVPFDTASWVVNSKYTGQKLRIQGVDCYHVVHTRADGVKSEYYITIKGKQVWRFQTFRGVWFDRVQ